MGRRSILVDYRLRITDNKLFDGRKLAYYNTIADFIKRKIVADRIVISGGGFVLEPRNKP